MRNGFKSTWGGGGEMKFQISKHRDTKINAGEKP